MRDHPETNDRPAAEPSRRSDQHEWSGISALEAVTGRRSVRHFLSAPVPDGVVFAILEAAARAPSGQNMQPWLVHFVTGESRERLCQAVTEAASAGRRSDEYAYFPKLISEPFLSRRRKVGYDLFSTYGIDRHDTIGRKRALLRNFTLFDAPVGLFFTMRRDWGLGAWLDMGNYMASVMTLARHFGLETCAQQAWAEYGEAVRQVLPIADDQVLVSGMALGYEDKSADVNRLRTEREPLERFVVRHA